MLQDFFPLVPAVLGHAALKNEEVDQTEWWAKQSLWSDSTMLPKSKRRVAIGVSKSRSFVVVVVIVCLDFVYLRESE